MISIYTRYLVTVFWNAFPRANPIVTQPDYVLLLFPILRCKPNPVECINKTVKPRKTSKRMHCPVEIFRMCDVAYGVSTPKNVLKGAEISWRCR